MTDMPQEGRAAPPTSVPADLRAPPAALVDLLVRHRVHVRRWRKSMSGMAWNAPGPDGPLTRWIEAPMPRSSMSWAVALHEIGHHALGIGRFSPRCLEEYHAWRWAHEAMSSLGIAVDDRVRRRIRDSLFYAVAKARRRGLVALPPELERFLAGSGAHDARGTAGFEIRF